MCVICSSRFLQGLFQTGVRTTTVDAVSPPCTWSTAMSCARTVMTVQKVDVTSRSSNKNTTFPQKLFQMQTQEGQPRQHWRLVSCYVYSMQHASCSHNTMLGLPPQSLTHALSCSTRRLRIPSALVCTAVRLMHPNWLRIPSTPGTHTWSML